MSDDSHDRLRADLNALLAERDSLHRVGTIAERVDYARRLGEFYNRLTLHLSRQPDERAGTRKPVSRPGPYPPTVT